MCWEQYIGLVTTLVGDFSSIQLHAGEFNTHTLPCRCGQDPMPRSEAEPWRRKTCLLSSPRSPPYKGRRRYDNNHTPGSGVAVRWPLGTSPPEKGAGAGWVSGAEGHCSRSAVSKQQGKVRLRRKGWSHTQGWWAKGRSQLIPTFTDTAVQRKHRIPDKPIFSRWHGRVYSRVTFSIFHYQQS